MRLILDFLADVDRKRKEKRIEEERLRKDS